MLAHRHIAAVLLYIHQLPLLGWTTIPLLLASGISGFLLISYDRRQTRPFFARRIYPDGRGYHAFGASSILGAGFLGYTFLVTAAFYSVMKWDARTMGFLFFPYSIVSALVSKWLNPVLFHRFGIARVAQLALVLLLAGILMLLTGIGTGQLIYFLISLFLITAWLSPSAIPALSILSLTGVSADRQGIAAGLQAAIYTTGTGIGLSLIGLCLQAYPSGGEMTRGGHAIQAGQTIHAGQTVQTTGTIHAGQPGASSIAASAVATTGSIPLSLSCMILVLTCTLGIFILDAQRTNSSPRPA